MSRQIKFSIDQRILDKFPNYRRAIVVATGTDNQKLSMLGDDIAKIAQNIKNDVTLEDHRIVEWREAFAAVGLKARDFRPSIDALVRRILNDKPLGSISPIVDVGTVVSLQFVLPAGAHPILADTTNVALTLASGDEIDVSDGTHPSEQVPFNEPILVDTGKVATRCWVWRQTSQSRIDGSTQDFYLNIDALGAIDETTLNEAIEFSKQTIKRVFDCDAQVVNLSASNPVATVEID